MLLILSFLAGLAQAATPRDSLIQKYCAGCHGATPPAKAFTNGHKGVYLSATDLAILNAPFVTPSPSPTASPSPSPSPSASPSITPTVSPTPSATPSPAPSPTAQPSPSPSPSGDDGGEDDSEEQPSPRPTAWPSVPPIPTPTPTITVPPYPSYVPGADGKFDHFQDAMCTTCHKGPVLRTHGSLNCKTCHVIQGHLVRQSTFPKSACLGCHVKMIDNGGNVKCESCHGSTNPHALTSSGLSNPHITGGQ